MPNYSGSWTLQQQMQAQAASNWPFGGPFNYIDDVFSTFLYTGTGASNAINNGIDLAGKGGLVWTKPRNNAFEYHHLVDTVRGGNNALYSNDTSAQSTASTYITSFNSNGFTLGTSSGMNGSGLSMCSWTFREAPKFFDVVTYTGDGSGERQIPHNLGSQPGMVAIKAISESSDWNVRHIGAGTRGFKLNTTAAGEDIFGAYNTSFTSTTFYTTTTNVTYDSFNTNRNGVTYVAYLFAHNAGGFGTAGTDNVISCGSYSGSGAAGNPITLGYEPQFILVKPSSAVDPWIIVDTMRGDSLTSQLQLKPNASDAEFNGGGPIPTATGFNFASGDSAYNGSGNTYIYMAIRRPMKPPTVGTQVFSPVAYTGNGSTRSYSVGFPTDLSINMNRDEAGDSPTWNDRLRGNGVDLYSSGTSAEVSYGAAGFTFDSNINAIVPSYRITNTIKYIDWIFRRATGFFDVVCYTGTGTQTAFNHNLTVAPELAIIKRRDAVSTQGWATGTNFTSTSFLNLLLNTTAAGTTNNYADVTLFKATPTSTTFTVGSFAGVNASGGTYVAYLFASVAGVSKVGSYTGTGAAQVINCAFTAGARFVLIKRTDSTGDWYVWDSARGIVAGNDPYLLLNSTAAEVTNTDFVDTAATGFELSSTAPAAINASGGSYIFLAIA